MRVSKVGGSLLTEGSILGVVSTIIKRDLEDGKLILVVSAMKGVTDDLIAAYENEDQSLLGRVLDRYMGEANMLGLSHVVRFLDYIQQQLREIMGIREPWAKDYFVIHGELLSAMLMEGVLRDALGVNAKAVYNPGIVTDEKWGEALVMPESEENVKYVLNNALGRYDVVIVPGFLGVSRNGRYTALGRGGSDYTASLIASYMNAKRLTYYTDSGGVLSGDPNFVEDPVLVPTMSYEEAHAASRVGAKKFHPRTFEPLMKSRVKTFITSPWSLEGTYVINNCIKYPKVVSLRRYGDHGALVSVVGCVMGDEEYRGEAMELIMNYEPAGITEVGDNLISVKINEWDAGMKLARELHGWVRKWIA